MGLTGRVAEFGSFGIATMLFTNPMWDNEAERIGKQKCTPLGYSLHVVSDVFGFLALLLLFGDALYVIYRGIAGEFHASLLWFALIPVLLAILGAILYRVSWWLARRRGFHYDCDCREASWIEQGQRRTYKYVLLQQACVMGGSRSG